MQLLAKKTQSLSQSYVIQAKSVVLAVVVKAIKPFGPVGPGLRARPGSRRGGPQIGESMLGDNHAGGPRHGKRRSGVVVASLRAVGRVVE